MVQLSPIVRFPTKKSITTLPLLYWRPTGKVRGSQWRAVCCWTCVKLVYSCTGLGNALDPAAFAWPVVSRNRCVWAIHASGLNPSKMDISGLLGGFPKQPLQGRGHGEATGCSLTVKSSAQENQTSLHVHLTVVFWPSFTAGKLLWSSQR